MRNRIFYPVFHLLATALLVMTASCGKKAQTDAMKPVVLLEPIHCVAIMPFENLTTYPAAGQIVGDYFSSELYASEKFRVMDRMEVQQSARRINLRIPDRISAEFARQMGENLGVDGVFYGSVSEYWYPNTAGTEESEQVRMGDEPAVSFNARLMSVESGEILWSASISRSSYDVLAEQRDPLSRIAQVAIREMTRDLVKQLRQRQIDLLTPCGKAPAPLDGRFHGKVVEAGTDTPVSGAAMMVKAPKELRISVHPQSGEFLTPPVPAGVVKYTVLAEGFAPKEGLVEVLSNENISHNVEMEPVTRRRKEPAGPRPGVIGGRVLAPGGAALAAQIRLDPDPGFGIVTSDAQTGRFSKEVPPGAYTAIVTAEGYNPREKAVSLNPGQNYFMEVTMEAKRPERSTVTLAEDHITLTDQVHFKTGSTQIDESSYPLLEEIAGVIKDHPELKLIQIEGHTDDQGGALANQRLSQGRAEAVRDFLVKAGVQGERLTALGFGEAVPIAENTTPEGRARNRRVEFTILSRSGGN